MILFLAVYGSISEKITVQKGQKSIYDFAMSAKADNNRTAGLFDHASVKTASANAATPCYVIPSGEAIGVKLYTDGILVLNTGRVSGKDGQTAEPAKKAGIESGDRIMAVNETPVSDIFSLKRLVAESGGNVFLTVIRDGEALKIPVTAVYSEDEDAYLLGIWVRDSAAGIGTLTFYNPQNSTFAALGHGICDYDTDSILHIREGSVNYCRVKNVVKSEDGRPGELLGDFNAPKLGEITQNSNFGIYGKSPYPKDITPIPVASCFETEAKPATLICDIDGNGPKSYDIEITKISKNATDSNKSFVFRITDPGLIEKTGGIVQGMSGSPIIQNGRLVGAVTHVFVNDPSKGYGIFAENMLNMTNMLN